MDARAAGRGRDPRGATLHEVAMYYSKNLRDTQQMQVCKPGSMPWEFDLDAAVKAYGKERIAALANKKARAVFMTDPETVWHIYSLAEPLNPNQRANKKDNPVVKIHGLVIDFDAKLSAECIDRADELRLPPSWVEETLSGNYRMLWLFEKPANVINSAHGQRFLSLLGRHLKVKSIGPGLDQASYKPEQSWTNGGRWDQMTGKPLPADLTDGFLIRALKGLMLSDPDAPPSANFPAIAEALKERYPRFGEWEEEFVEGSQGPSFWVDGSKTAKSAVVKAEGMFTFSETASKAFFSWAELLGRDVADGLVSRQMSEATKNIFYDGMRYFTQDAAGIYYPYPVDPLSRMLRIQHRLDARRNAEGYSQVEEAFHYAETINRVAVAGTLVPFRPGAITFKNEKYLNTWVPLYTKPVEQDVTEWGDGFPILGAHLAHFFDEEQLRKFLQWLAVFYNSVLNCKPCKGQALFLMGGTGIGKGLLSYIVEVLVGGGTRAEELIAGTDTFGGECYAKPLMRIDDMAAHTGKNALIKFTEKVKGHVANDMHRFHVKHQMAGTIPWFGRIMVTLNDDQHSMNSLPDFAASVEDKISLFYGNPEKSDWIKQLVGLEERQAVIRKEAPYIARFLLNYLEDIPLEDRDDRYGVKVYHYPRLRAEVDEDKSSSSLYDVLAAYFHSWFEGNQTDKEWKGKAHELYRNLIGAGLIGPGTAFQYTNAKQLGRALRTEEHSPDNRERVTARRYSNSKVAAVWTVTRDAFPLEGEEK